MAEQAEGVSTYPLPPMKYYKIYTDDNVSTGHVPAPPRLPTGEYFVFGCPYHIHDPLIRQLEEQNIPRLYKTGDEASRIEEMKKLNTSILITFLDLLHILSNSPTSPDRLARVEHLKVNKCNIISNYKYKCSGL